VSTLLRVSLGLGLLGCTAGPKQEETEPGQAPALEPIEPAPIEAPLDDPPKVEPARAPSTEPRRLTPVVVRDGPLHLLGDGERAWLIVDGEPRELGPTGPMPPVPSDLGSMRGRETLEFEVSAYVEAPGGEAFLAAALDENRAALDGARVYRRSEGVWAPVAERTNRLPHHPALFVREGGVFGVRELRRHPRDEAVSEFVRLAGPDSATMPVAPSGAPIREVVATTDGSVYALQSEYPDLDEEDAPPILLSWPPRQAHPDRIVLPEATGTEGLELSASGSDVLVFGRPLHLAIGRGREFRRVRVTLPEALESDENVGHEIAAALSASDGGLWLALGYDTSISGLLLHRAPGQDWTRVDLPKMPAEIDQRWRFLGGGWAKVAAADLPPHIESLAWSAGRPWILVHHVLADREMPLPGLGYEVLYTVGEIGREPEELAPIDRRWFELASTDSDVPGVCRTFSIVLGPGVRPSNTQVEALKQLDGLRGSIVYIGSIEGHRELVVQASAEDRAAAGRLIADVGAAMGFDVRADCRPRELIEVLIDRRDG
jgi:hypothetical protein